MLKFIEVTGKTKEEAIEKGLAQLGLDQDDVSVEILDLGKSGFLGIGSIPARVKLSYEGPDEEEPAPVEEKVAEKKPAPKAEEPKVEPVKAPAAPVEPKVEPVKASAAPVEQSGDAVIDAIVKFQTGLFAHMGVEVTPVVTKEGDTYQVVLEGENMGALIGHRGETLDAIQQLTGYAVNHGRSHRARIHVDTEGYRARREESLERLARKTASRVIKNKRNQTLEPMNAYERHVIHSALQDFAGVTTYSTGTEPNRRTVVAYDPGKK